MKRYYFIILLKVWIVKTVVKNPKIMEVEVNPCEEDGCGV